MNTFPKFSRYITKEVKAAREKAERACNYFMNVENNAAAYHDYLLVVDKSKEYAEKILNTPLA